jgi:hypothetical protein
MFELDKKTDLEFEEDIKDYSKFIVTSDSINNTVTKFFNGEIKKGYEIGIPCFDEHFVCKEKELYALTGQKGGGKTTINMAIQMMQSVVNGLVWVCAYQENADWGSKLNYLNYFLGEFPRDVKKSKPELYKLASDWIDKHFIFLDVETIKDALETTEYLVSTGVNVHAVILDPVNSFKGGYDSIGNGYLDNVETARIVQRWAHKVCSVYVSQHPTMMGQRNKDRPMTSSDAEGGHWLNKADFTWVVHREKDTNLNHIIVEDVRSKHTGGGRTSEDNQLMLNWSATEIDIIRGKDNFKNVIQYLVRRHKPIDYDFDYLPSTKEIIKPTNPKDAF